LQAFALDSSKGLRQYALRTWTSEQGLPQNSISCVLQTRDGLLWIGTRSGLARFDGAEFVQYRSGAPNSIPGESVTGLVEDSDGSLWISSNGGLSRYRSGHFQNYSMRDGLPEDSIWRIARDPAGGVWAATWRSEFFHFDGRTVHRYPGPIPQRPQEVNAVLEDPRGAVWIATFVGLFRLDQEKGFQRMTHQNGLSGDQVYALALDTHNQLWSAGEGGLSRQVDDHFISVPIPGMAIATVLAFDTTGPDGTIWTGSTGRGIIRLRSGEPERLLTEEGLVSDNVYLLYFSRDGSLWLGATNGLNQLSDGPISSYNTDQSLATSVPATRQTLDSVHDFLFGYGHSLIGIWKGSLISIGADNEGHRGDPDHRREQTPLYFMDAGSIWNRTTNRSNQGLIVNGRLQRDTPSYRSLQSASPSIRWSSVDTALIDQKGTIWTGGSDIGVVAYAAQHAPTFFNMTNGLDDDAVGALAEDATGDVWVGTLAGLNRIHNGVITHVASCRRVTSIDAAGDGSVWAGCESGLVYVPPASAGVRVFTQREGLLTNLVMGVTEDTFGYLWLGTNNGVVRVKKADLLGSGGNSRISQVVFGVGDGLRGSQIVTNSIFRSHDGDIWFMTVGALAAIDPHAIQPKTLAPILIDRVNIDDQDIVSASASLNVPAGRHRLRISYTLPDFQIASRLRFRYRLVGWDHDWVEAGPLREATYTAIPSGHYTFEVVNSDGYGNWESKGTTLFVQVQPYFYQTWWFFILLGSVCSMLVWKLHQIRVHQISASIDERLQERLKERTRIARELHDTLLQGVLGVGMQMFAASQHPNEGSAAVLAEASCKLREIAEQSRKAVEDLRSPSVDTNSFEGALVRVLQDIPMPADIQFTSKSIGDPIRLRPLVQTEIEQIVREAFANAVRHSGASSICLDIVYQPVHLLVSITDDGSGIETGLEKCGRIGHWGIKGMRERAETLGGRVQIFSRVPSGTVVEIYLPGTVAYLENWRRQGASVLLRIIRRRTPAPTRTLQ
jgi:ligand-binding sensor domain-containing protein/signal transduction histidine kinase